MIFLLFLLIAIVVAVTCIPNLPRGARVIGWCLAGLVAFLLACALMGVDTGMPTWPRRY